MFSRISCIFDANNIDPDQMPRCVASDLGLHCLLTILLEVSRLNGGRIGVHIIFTSDVGSILF